MTPIDERPAVLLSRIQDVRKRHELMLLASVLECPEPRVETGGWVVVTLAGLAMLGSCHV